MNLEKIYQDGYDQRLIFTPETPKEHRDFLHHQQGLKALVKVATKSLQTENQRLRDALERIVGTPGNLDHREIAQSALAHPSQGKPVETEEVK